MASTERKIMRPRVGFILILLCLSAPSLWMLATIPPLWKDVDAYLQVTESPNVITILHYAPGYCFFARLPLYLGHTYDCLRAGAPIPTLAFFASPTLSDSGVFLLVAAQHAALVCAAMLLILSAAQSFSARWALAVLWAANPLFYAVAHCVGSETFSLILILFLAGAGWRLIKQPGRAGLRPWLLFALLLWLSILTRHIDNVLAVLLPLGFIFAALCRFGGSLREESARVRSWLRRRAREDLRRAVAAGVLGIVCVFLAIGFVQLLCWAADITYRSRLGYTFTWRLDFLATLSAEERERVIAQAEAKTKSEDVRRILNLLRTVPTRETSRPEVSKLVDAEFNALTPEGQVSGEAFDAALNGTARALLLPLSPALVRAAVSDFAQSQKSDAHSVIKHLVSATTYFFDHRERMPACANLVTFRDRNFADIRDLTRQYLYLHLWKNLGHRWVLLAALAAIAFVVRYDRRRSAAFIAYPMALLLTGLLLMFANCFVVAFRPRFSIPMWGLTVAAVILLFGNVAEIVLAWTRGSERNVRRATSENRDLD